VKILGIVGSPRGTRGNTAALLKIVLEGAQSEGAQTEIIAIRGQEIKPCKACNTCHKLGVCPQKDGFNAIKEKALAADGLVLASPNYIFHVSAQLKAFLDRCASLIHCMALEGKYGASVVTSGGGDEKPIADYLNHFLVTTGAAPVGSVWATMGNIYGKGFPEEIRENALVLGKELAKACRDKTVVHGFEQEASRFRARMKSLMIRRQNEWPYEVEFWKKYRGL
jgi:multimeric flavodoxin WrbA